MKLHRIPFALGALALSLSAVAADPIKIAVIDPLSGPFANVGEAMVHHAQFSAGNINARGGVLGTKFEIVPLDSKSNPQEAQLAIKQAVDQGIRFVMQTNGSNVAAAIIDAVNKHNERNPDKTVMFLNTGAVDPALTNDKCSFWHFRFDADADMKMAALTDTIAQNKKIKKLYIINQDYAFGQAVSKIGQSMMTKKRPDVEIVGNELHPLGKIKDFAPYIAKIMATGADAILTGNWGNDMTLFIKASRDADYKPEFYTYYAGGLGTPPAIGDAGIGHLKQVTAWHANINEKAGKGREAYEKKFPEAKEDLFFTSHRIALEMLAKAIGKAKSTEPAAVGKALEGMKFDDDSGEVYMRADNHQLIQPLYVSTYFKVDGKEIKFDVEKTGNGFKTDNHIDGKATVMPTTCKMNRPS